MQRNSITLDDFKKFGPLTKREKTLNYLAIKDRRTSQAIVSFLKNSLQKTDRSGDFKQVVGNSFYHHVPKYLNPKYSGNQPTHVMPPLKKSIKEYIENNPWCKRKMENEGLTTTYDEFCKNVDVDFVYNNSLLKDKKQYDDTEIPYTDLKILLVVRPIIAWLLTKPDITVKVSNGLNIGKNRLKNIMNQKITTIHRSGKQNKEEQEESIKKLKQNVSPVVFPKRLLNDFLDLLRKHIPNQGFEIADLISNLEKLIEEEQQEDNLTDDDSISIKHTSNKNNSSPLKRKRESDDETESESEEEEGVKTTTNVAPTTTPIHSMFSSLFNKPQSQPQSIANTTSKMPEEEKTSPNDMAKQFLQAFSQNQSKSRKIDPNVINNILSNKHTSKPR